MVDPPHIVCHGLEYQDKRAFLYFCSFEAFNIAYLLRLFTSQGGVFSNLKSFIKYIILYIIEYYSISLGILSLSSKWRNRGLEFRIAISEIGNWNCERTLAKSGHPRADIRKPSSEIGILK